MSIQALMEQNGIDVVDVPKTKITAKRMAQLLRERGTWSTLTVRRAAKAAKSFRDVLAAKRTPKVAKVTEISMECPCCEGTGIFHGAKWSRPCFRCKGTGTMTRQDITRYEVYQGHQANGTAKYSVDSHANEEYWESAIPF
jgi:RecJ-like exonuclease